MKKVLSLFIALLMVFTIAVNASATSNETNVCQCHIRTVFNVNDYSYDGFNTTNIGGISVGAANNRLFVVKSNSEQEISTLYYYNNIYNSGFANGTRLPKRIVFSNYLLGHANAMAVDDDYVYVTMWQQNGLEKNKILQISRKAIGLLTDGTVINNEYHTVTDENGDTVRVCRSYAPITTNFTEYTRSITSITKYSYNAATHVTKFIIGYSSSSDKTSLTYTIATLQSGVFVVSESNKDKFTVTNPCATPNASPATVTMQDIFYDAEYGLFIPMWLQTGINAGLTNKLLCVDISSLKTRTENGTYSAFTPYDILSITKNSDANGTLTKFEMESLAFVKRDADRNPSDFRLVFSCNKSSSTNPNCDSIEEITPLRNYLNPLT